MFCSVLFCSVLFCSVLQRMALASQTEANGSHQRSSTWPLALTFVEQAGKIAEHDLSSPASLEITTRSERWANPQRRPSSSRPSVRLRRAKYELSPRRRHPEGLGHHWGLRRFGILCHS